ncbi:ATP-binding protein [Methylorubrum extorquens]|uniref:ATP-binding protein n=1 Tax=Methylorubrum extorquens TaxID=408 RepID=UPI0020A0D682|nr:DUF87 domain-containing protein [Methylorubrum extorquens]MCP1540118.1 DNA helicase HerA-like ATPase [Methylorubrum extorquens]
MIGHNEAGQGVSLNAKALIGTHACIIGNTGSGKTHTIRKLLEESWGEAIHIVIDPEMEFHTLRQAQPYVIAGGPNADVPHGHPAALARSIVESGSSTIIQFAEHQHLEAQQAFIAAFIDGLMMLPRALWRPVFLVIDEAHRYAPQAGGALSLRPISTLMSQGRKRGFTGILATQRLAKLNKNASGEANTWLVGRVGQVTDMRAAANNLGFSNGSDEAAGLRTLRPGQFWGFGVALSPTPELLTIAATKTQHMTLGQSFKPQPIEVPAAMRSTHKRGGEGTLNVVVGLCIAGALAFFCVLPKLF